MNEVSLRCLAHATSIAAKDFEFNKLSEAMDGLHSSYQALEREKTELMHENVDFNFW